MLVQEQVLGDKQRKLRTFRGLRAHIRDDLLQGEALPRSQGDRTKLAASSASSRDFHRTIRRTVPQRRNALHARAVSFPLSRDRLAANRGFKQFDNPVFRLSVEDAIYQPLVLQAFLLDLPRTRAADDDLQVRLVLAKQGMKDQAAEFLGIDRFHVGAIAIRADGGGDGKAPRVGRRYA